MIVPSLSESFALFSSDYAPNFEEVDRAYWFRIVRESVRVCMHVCIRSSKIVHARVLKFHIWIPHGKIAETCFFFLSELSPFLELRTFKKIKMKSDSCHTL